MRSKSTTRIRHSQRQLRSLRRAPVLPACILALLTASLPTKCLAATAQGTASLVLRIEPQATMTITSLPSEMQPESGGVLRLVQVKLVIRMNPGATAALTLHPISRLGQPEEGKPATPTFYIELSGSSLQILATGDSPQIIFTAQHSGRFELKIGVVVPPSSQANTLSTENVLLELKSSDQALHLAETVSFNR